MTRKGLSIDGIEEVQNYIDGQLKKDARNLNRATVHAIAGVVRDEAKQNAPKDTGTLRKAIKAIRRKPKNPDKPFSDVNVTHGNDARHDAFYWRFLEYGTSTGVQEHGFFRKAVADIKPRIPGLFKDLFFKRLEAKIKRDARREAGLIK